ncbi:tetratricopeptide repeat protein [Streptomyces griseoluteus]|uniref:tetratricopeptide repeat protein n=1 Tax=Streptomyces griseoluteus TaxID=29306 RepID=UPI0036EC6D57
MGEHADRLRSELRALYEAADQPLLSQLVGIGRQQRPPVSVSDATVSAWLTGTSVPSLRFTPYFLAMVGFLGGRPSVARSGFVPRPRAWWAQALDVAQKERAAGRGRPRAAADEDPGTGPVTLLADPVAFTGRAEQVGELLGYLDPGTGRDGTTAVSVSAVTGMGGVGKTALVLHAAHRARSRGWFPGGALFIDLRGYHDGAALDAAQAADRLLRVLGVKDRDIPAEAEEKLSLWRARLAGLAEQDRPLLAVVDNVHSLGQVAPLVPSAPHRLLVTSRRRLSALSARHISVGPLTVPEAVDFLDRALRVGDAADDRALTQRPDAERLAELCGRLPLALQIMVALLREERHRPLADHCAELADARNRLDALQYDDTDGQGRPLAVRAAFDLSLRHLTQPQQEAFRLLSLAPGPDIATGTAAELFDLPVPAARRLLAALARAHLLIGSPRERWQTHDLVRLYAAEQARAHLDADERETAETRLIAYHVRLAAAADTVLRSGADSEAVPPFADHAAARSWLEDEHTCLLAAVASFSSVPRHMKSTLVLANRLTQFLGTTRHFDELSTLADMMMETARAAGERRYEGLAFMTRGSALMEIRQFGPAIEAHEEAERIFTETGDTVVAADALTNLSIALRHLRRFDEAAAALTRASALLEESDHPMSNVAVLGQLGTIRMGQERFEESIDAYERALRLATGVASDLHLGMLLDNYGNSLEGVGRFEEAVDAHQRAYRLFQDMNDVHRQAVALGNLAGAHWELGRFEEALETLRAVHDTFRGLGDSYSEAVALDNIGACLQALDRMDEAAVCHERAMVALRDMGDAHQAEIAAKRLAEARQAPTDDPGGEAP